MNLKAVGPVYVQEFDIEVNPYLTTAQIQQIAKAVVVFDNWSEREMNKNMLLMFHATNIGKEELDKHEYSELDASGIFEIVGSKIKNKYKIDEAINHMEIIQRQRVITQILSKIAPMLEMIKQKVNKNGTTSKK